MAANNVYDFEKKFHLKYGRNPRPDEYWKAATDAAEENSNSSPSGQPTGDKSEPSDICSICIREDCSSKGRMVGNCAFRIIYG